MLPEIPHFPWPKKLSSTVQGLISSNPSYQKVPIRVDLLEESSPSTSGERTGAKRRRYLSVMVVAETDTGCLLGGSSIGSPKITLEETARMAVQQVVGAMEGGGCVDDFLQDQLILYMALAGGVSEVVTNSLTLHTRTAIWLTSWMLPSVRFQVTKLGAKEDDELGRDGTNLLPPQPPSENDHKINEDVSGRIPGLHRIRCYGIGFVPKDQP
mmetsp:Transcript_20137/g.42624  ORF Transcript_20137/g.42624 Transcript_20137/m.42624 type:complete len:212 (-) Transcript_20137:135-770(-)